MKSNDTVKPLRPADEIVQSLINLRDELYARQDHRLSEALFKINSCLYSGYKVEKNEPVKPVLEPVEGDLLPPVGSRVYIRHARDNNAHACTVTGYYVWEAFDGHAWLHRVFVRMVYEGTQLPQTRILHECYPTEEAALAVNY